MKTVGIPAAALAMSVSMLSGCGNSGAAGGKEQAAADNQDYLKEPVTLMFKADFGDDMDTFNKLYGDRIRAKFPNVTINFIPRGEGTGITDLVAAGQYPDILYANLSTWEYTILDTGLAYDMSDLIKKHNVDLSKFEPVLIDNMRKANAEGALYGLPMPYSGTYVTFYNKDLFDKFGVPYPTDGMTWDQMFDLAKKMSRQDGDTIYRGFSTFPGGMMRDNQLSVPYLDPKEDKMYDPEKWKRLLTNLARFYDIPNNSREKSKSQTTEMNIFAQGKVALGVLQYGSYTGFPETMNWDMVTMPTFPEAPETGGQAGSAYWFISKTNEHKDISMEIIKYMLSDEVQGQFAKEQAKVPSLKAGSPAFQNFAKDEPKLQGKNVQAIFKYKPAATPPARAKGLIGADPNELKKTMENAVNELTYDHTDVNTVLRNASENMDKAIEAKKNQ